MQFHALELILRKRDGGTLSEADWHHLFQAHREGNVPDYQIAALLMAIYFRGLTTEETIALTEALVQTGETLDLSAIPGFVVDKHSTGGVGDKTTLVLAPLIAAYGLPVFKLAGRGLGFTGGTIDKLESIPGLRVDWPIPNLIDQVQKIGLAIASQSERLVPADQMLYALRDVTGTVENIELVAASVMSKKIASGADGVVLDVKVGTGAFSKTEEEAERLAGLLVAIGKAAGRKVSARITRMEQPLGHAVGNALEVAEAFAALRDEGPADLRQLALTLAVDMCLLARPNDDPAAVRAKLEKLLSSGYALEKLQQMIEAQGGDPNIVEKPQLLPRARVRRAVTLQATGWLQSLDAKEVGHIAKFLGAGRTTKEEDIDPSVGIVIWRKVGDQIHRGEPVATIHAASLEQAMAAEEQLEKLFVLSERALKKQEDVVTEQVFRSF